jgi:hypothetical protein
MNDLLSELLGGRPLDVPSNDVTGDLPSSDVTSDLPSSDVTSDLPSFEEVCEIISHGVQNNLINDQELVDMLSGGDYRGLCLVLGRRLQRWNDEVQFINQPIASQPIASQPTRAIVVSARPLPAMPVRSDIQPTLIPQALQIVSSTPSTPSTPSALSTSAPMRPLTILCRRTTGTYYYRCVYCSYRALFGTTRDKPNRCRRHSRPEHVHCSKTNRCPCGKVAIYGPIGYAAYTCGMHKQRGWIRLAYQCWAPGCTKCALRSVRSVPHVACHKHVPSAEQEDEALRSSAEIKKQRIASYRLLGRRGLTRPTR